MQIQILNSTHDNEYIFFSIVILAYKREQFLTQAVKSVLDQEYPRGNFEVIVVKAFNDPKIDYFLSSNNVISVFSDSKSYGQSLKDGLEKCQGEAILLLDDDDMFRNDKLSKLNIFLKEFPDLMVVVNSFKPIGLSTSISIEEFNLSHRKLINRTGVRIWNSSPYEEMLMSQAGMFWGTSKISFRKAFVPYLLGILNNISYMVDIFIILTAISNDVSIALFPEELTDYRLHELNVSVVHNGDDKIKKSIFSHDKLLADTYAISKFLEGSKPQLSEYFLLCFHMEQLKISILKENRKFILESAFVLVRDSVHNTKVMHDFTLEPLLTFKSLIGNLLFVPLLFLFPNLGKKLRLKFSF